MNLPDTKTKKLLYKFTIAWVILTILLVTANLLFYTSGHEIIKSPQFTVTHHNYDLANIISECNLRRFAYYFFFAIDVLWAFSLVAILFLSSRLLTRDKQHINYVPWIVLIFGSLGYMTDLYENYLYVFKISYDPVVSQIKMGL